MLSVQVDQKLGDFQLSAAFTAEPASITAIFGKSGAGKTSLINTIAGLSMPSSGLITVGSTPLFDAGHNINLPPHERQIGYIFQDDRLFPHLSVRNNLLYGTNRQGVTNTKIGLSDVTVLLGIGHLLDRKPGSLSGGEKQRVAIGRALLSNPRLLLMDEPLASLDVQRRHDILPFIEKIRDEFGVTILYVSHAIEEVIQLADKMIVLSNGRMAAEGTVEDIMSRLDLHPLTGRFDAGAVIATEFDTYESEFDLGRLSFPGGQLQVAGLNLEAGTPLRAHIRARDVSLMLNEPEGTSVLNVFKGTVTEVREEDGPQLDLLIDIGSSLIARVTRKSYQELGLKAGSEVYAMIKAVAIDRRSVGGAKGRSR